MISADKRRNGTEMPRRYCRCTSIIGLANPHCQIHGSQQRQDSLTDQMCSVVRWANEHGCYDAADWITEAWETAPDRAERQALREALHSALGYLSAEDDPQARLICQNAALALTDYDPKVV